MNCAGRPPQGRIASFQDGYVMSGGFVGRPVPGRVESVC